MLDEKLKSTIEQIEAVADSLSFDVTLRAKLLKELYEKQI